MRIAVAVFALALVVGAASVAHATTDPVAEGQTPPVAVPDEPIKPISPDEIQQPEGRSGFWTSRAPAKYGAYKWRLLGVGVILVGITGIVIMRMLKRTKRDNEKKTGPRWKNEPRLPDVVKPAQPSE
ncbi:MAG TPA: hypothetical protein VGM90_07020 [Kofleriaceae bacterium]|jgi:hypothetical protein